MQLLPMPVGGYPNQTVQAQLGDAFYVVGWRWNARDGAWYFSLSDVDGAPIVSGVRVVLNVDLLSSASATGRPKGAIAVLAPSGSATEPGLTDLGTRVKVVYVAPEEMTA